MDTSIEADFCVLVDWIGVYLTQKTDMYQPPPSHVLANIATHGQVTPQKPAQCCVEGPHRCGSLYLDCPIVSHHYPHRSGHIQYMLGPGGDDPTLVTTEDQGRIRILHKQSASPPPPGPGAGA